MAPAADESVPKYWEKLSEEDQNIYKLLQKTFASASCKNQRNRSKENFIDILNNLKTCIMRGNEDDKTRMLVYGICWLSNNRIAINTRQLKIILSKCKSSINGSFQSLGYDTVVSGTISSTEFAQMFPDIDKSELRQWSIRQPHSETPSTEKLIMYLKNLPSNNFVTPPPSSISPSTYDYGMSIGNAMMPQKNEVAPQYMMQNNMMYDPKMSMSAPPPEMTFQKMENEPMSPIEEENPVMDFEADEFSNFLDFYD